MTFKDRFLWKDGDLEFQEPCREPSAEEYERADSAISDMVARLQERENQLKNK